MPPPVSDRAGDPGTNAAGGVAPSELLLIAGSGGRVIWPQSTCPDPSREGPGDAAPAPAAACACCALAVGGAAVTWRTACSDAGTFGAAAIVWCPGPGAVTPGCTAGGGPAPGPGPGPGPGGPGPGGPGPGPGPGPGGCPGAGAGVYVYCW